MYKNNEYYLEKMEENVDFILEHMEGVSKEQLEEKGHFFKEYKRITKAKVTASSPVIATPAKKKRSDLSLLRMVEHTGLEFAKNREIVAI